MMQMMQGMMGGRLPPGIESENLPDPDSSGAKLLARYCTQCHNLPSPGMHTQEEWPTVTQRMFHRMSIISGMMGIEAPSVDEQEAIVAYLKTHSLKPMIHGILPSPESPEAISFKNTCSQCHALPDPKLHTADEWPNVVERMRTNMQNMGRRVITDQEMNEIVSYLATRARQSNTPD
jgi:cytochrome c5